MSDAARPALVAPRGRRYCTRCRSVERHTSTERLSTLGKRLLVLTVVITAGLFLHSALRYDRDKPGLLLLLLLPPIAAVILLGMALKQRCYDVRCERCGETETRLSPPRWESSGPAKS